MIYKFKDHKEEDYYIEFFMNPSKTVTFQITSPEQDTTDVQLNGQQLSDMIGCMLTLQSKIKKAV